MHIHDAGQLYTLREAQLFFLSMHQDFHLAVQQHDSCWWGNTNPCYHKCNTIQSAYAIVHYSIPRTGCLKPIPQGWLQPQLFLPVVRQSLFQFQFSSAFLASWHVARMGFEPTRPWTKSSMNGNTKPLGHRPVCMEGIVRVSIYARLLSLSYEHLWWLLINNKGVFQSWRRRDSNPRGNDSNA